MKTWVINLYGGPGTGKSTLAAELFAMFKHKNLNVELVREYAKELCWENRPIDSPLKVLVEQYERQRILAGQVDVIVTDSPLLLAAVYADSKDMITKRLARELFDQFNNYDVFLHRIKPFNQAGRYHNEIESKRYDAKIKSSVGKQIDFDLELDADDSAMVTLYRYILDDLKVGGE